MTKPHDQRTGVLFVCLGNICRSPLAKCIFGALVDARGLAHLFDVDSCGIGGWHAGDAADPRSVAAAARKGARLMHTARKVQPSSDFHRFRWIIAMDHANREDLLALGADAGRVRLIRSFDPASVCGNQVADVPDPYYGSAESFDLVYDMLVPACEGLLHECLQSRCLPD